MSLVSDPARNLAQIADYNRPQSPDVPGIAWQKEVAIRYAGISVCSWRSYHIYGLKCAFLDKGRKDRQGVAHLYYP